MKPWAILLTALLCLCGRESSAQPAVSKDGSLQIRITATTGIPLDAASIRLIRLPDSALVKTAVADSLGAVGFPALPTGNYYLCITHVNFEPNCQQIQLQQELQTLHIQLQQSASMEAVTVTARKPPLQFLTDRTIVRVDASISNAGTNALEVLERSPGVTIDKDGNISLKGRNQVLVMIDNKPSYLSGAELTALLEGMSSNDIETIELIDNPPANYDAAGNGGIIHLKLKKNRQRGLNGNVNFSVAQGRYPKTNNSVSLNYFSGKINLFGNYSYIRNENYMDLYALRTYFDQNDGRVASLLEQPTHTKNAGISNNFRAGLDYTLNKRTTAGILVSGSLIDRSGTGTGEASWKNANAQPDSLINTQSITSSDWRNANVNLNLRHQFSATQSFNADLDWLGYNIKGIQEFSNIRQGNVAYSETFLGNLPRKIQIISFKADHQIQLPKSFKLESGIKWARTSTDSKAAYTVNTGTGWTDDLGRSNQFLYDEDIKAVYASVQRKVNAWWYQLGLRYEHTSLDAHQLGNAVVKDSAFSRSYGNFFPSLQLSYELDSINELSINLNKRIDRPAYQSLNPFIFIINKYTYQLGNPLMKPQLTFNVEISHRYKELLQTSISYSDSRDYFSQLFLTDGNGIFYYSEGNLGRRKILGLSVSFSKDLLPIWSLNAQADLQYKKLNGFVWKPLEANITQANISINNQFKLGAGVTAEFSGYYITRSQADIQEVVEPTGQVGVGIAKQILKNKGTLKLSARDIFYTQAMAGLTAFEHASEYFRLQRDTRVVNLSFGWRFGKPVKAPERKRSNVDEAERVGN